GDGIRFAGGPLPRAAGPSMAMIPAPPLARDRCPLRACPPRSDLRGGAGAPSTNREMETAAASALPLWHGERGAEPLHQRTELGKAGGDGVCAVNSDGAIGTKPQRATSPGKTPT